MKHIFFIGTLLVMSFSAFAQTDSSNRKYYQGHSNGFIFKDGKTMVIKNGSITPLTATLVLPNGVQVSPNGAVLVEHGIIWKMGEGEYVDMLGKKRPAKMHPEQNIHEDTYIVHD